MAIYGNKATIKWRNVGNNVWIQVSTDLEVFYSTDSIILYLEKLPFAYGFQLKDKNLSPAQCTLLHFQQLPPKTHGT